MSTLAGEKRKNDERRMIPWWLLLLVGFGLGIVFTLGASMGRGGAVTVYSSESLPPNFAELATLRAQDAQNKLALGQIDLLLATATAFVSEATLQSGVPGGFDTLNATATAIIQQATLQAPSGSP